MEERKAMASFVKRKKKEEDEEYYFAPQMNDGNYSYYDDKSNQIKRKRRKKSIASWEDLNEDDVDDNFSESSEYSESQDDMAKKNWSVLRNKPPWWNSLGSSE